MNVLFDNPGKKMKSLAIVLFIVILIIGLVVSYILAQETVYAHWDYVEQTNGGKFFLGFVVSVVLAYISALCVYAFGELVENSKIAADAISKMNLPKEESNENPNNTSSKQYDYKLDHIEPIFKDSSAEESKSIDPMEKLGV